MYRSLYFKIILILIIFIATVMAIVGTILLNGVSRYFADDFRQQMEEGFDPDAALSGYLSDAAVRGDGAAAMAVMLDAYSGHLGLDANRSAAILDENGTVLAVSDTSSMFAVGEMVYLTPNILAVMNGRDGSEQRAGAASFDFCIPVSSDTESFLIYVRDSKEEMQNLNWKLFSFILQALLSIALIVVTMMQSGKEAGLSGALAGNSDSYMNKSKMGGLDKMLAKATKWIALAWIVLTLILCLV